MLASDLCKTAKLKFIAQRTLPNWNSKTTLFPFPTTSRNLRNAKSVKPFEKKEIWQKKKSILFIDCESLSIRLRLNLRFVFFFSRYIVFLFFKLVTAFCEDPEHSHELSSKRWPHLFRQSDDGHKLMQDTSLVYFESPCQPQQPIIIRNNKIEEKWEKKKKGKIGVTSGDMRSENFFLLTLLVIPCIPRIAVCGGLMIGVPIIDP